ncbi:MAG: helix-turn-helix domain-containing protein, partial [Candidatus Gastranaerophilaceae bacterium]
EIHLSINDNKKMNKKILGLNIKAERNRKNFSQAELGEKANLSPTSISLIETGLQLPSALAIFYIAKALEIDINELYKGIK